jgi:hypothetical protein
MGFRATGGGAFFEDVDVAKEAVDGRRAGVGREAVDILRAKEPVGESEFLKGGGSFLPLTGGRGFGGGGAESLVV